MFHCMQELLLGWPHQQGRDPVPRRGVLSDCRHHRPVCARLQYGRHQHEARQEDQGLAVKVSLHTFMLHCR